jgi:hypothetical protein
MEAINHNRKKPTESEPTESQLTGLQLAGLQLTGSQLAGFQLYRSHRTISGSVARFPYIKMPTR